MPKTTSRKRRSPLKRLPKGPHGGVELLLIHSVDYLGKQGEIVEVRPGYANNYLLPQGMATMATEHHKRMVDKHRAKLEAIEKDRLAGIQKIADDIAQLSITIEANANDEGHLYGSVGAAEITAALKAQGHTVSGDEIRLEGALKELGLYNVTVQLHSAIQTELKVWVVPVSDARAETP